MLPIASPSASTLRSRIAVGAAVAAIVAAVAIVVPQARALTATRSNERVRLVLDTSERAGETYASAWSDAPVVVTRADLAGGDVAFVRAFPPDDGGDGCTWEATETLTRIDDDHFAYRYADRALACPASSARAPRPSTRTGVVTLAAADDDAPLTPRRAITQRLERGPELCGSPPVNITR